MRERSEWASGIGKCHESGEGKIEQRRDGRDQEETRGGGRSKVGLTCSSERLWGPELWEEKNALGGYFILLQGEILLVA